MTQVLSYGGGVQTVAMCLLVARGVLPRPDRIVMADTGREVQSTFDYLDAFVRPLMRKHGLTVEVVSHDLATVDLYGKNGDLLMPVFTATGKLPTFCSNEWKQRPIQRYLREQGITAAGLWIGYTLEERRRAKPEAPGPWQKSYPLLDLLITRDDCQRIIAGFGWPLPKKSRCKGCPHSSNAEFLELKRDSPAEWEEAVALDHELREADERGGVYLHRSLVPLSEADLSAPDQGAVSQCGLGMCWV